MKMKYHIIRRIRIDAVVNGISMPPKIRNKFIPIKTYDVERIRKYIKNYIEHSPKLENNIVSVNVSFEYDTYEN